MTLGMTIHNGYGQWTAPTLSNIIHNNSNMQVEIGTGTSVDRGWNNAWINTYSDNCNPANFNPSSPTLSSPQNTNHIKMTQIGIVHGYFESIVSNGGESGGGGSLISGGLSHDCAEQTDYYFRTDVEGAKLILDVETTTKGHYQYLSFFNHSINLHQKTKVDADLTVSGSSNLQAVTVSGNSNLQAVTVSGSSNLRDVTV